MTKRKILIIGAGGIGSYLIPVLNKTGLYDMTVYDPDIVETKNITYQNYDSSEVGGKKVNALEKRYNINAEPYLVLTDKQLKGYSLVICCADNLDVRRLLYRNDVDWLDLRSQGRNAVLISSAVSPDKMDAVLIGPKGSFSCQGGDWSGKTKDIHYTHIAVAGMGAQWAQRFFNNEEVCDFKIINI